MSGTDHIILNEHSGVWDEGVWYSNTSYKPWVQKQETLFDCISKVNLKGADKVEVKFTSGDVMHIPKRTFIANYNFYDYTISLAKKIDDLVNRWSKHGA